MPNLNLSDSILATLAYSDIFHTPLTASEIQVRLLGFKANLSQVKRELNHLLKLQTLSFREGYYFFTGRQAILKLYRQRQLVSQLKLRRAKSLAAKLANLPTILGIYLTGSLAVNNASPQADIDFLIIARINSLWTTRFFLNLFLDLAGLRRKPHDQSPKDKLCLNLYLTPQSLALPKIKRNLHSAYELIQTKPLFERQPFQVSLYQANSWLLDYLPNFTLPSSSKPFLQDKFFNPFERFFFRFQYLYMKPKISHELIGSQFAFFHPQPLQPQISRQLHQRLIRYNMGNLWPKLRLYLI